MLKKTSGLSKTDNSFPSLLSIVLQNMYRLLSFVYLYLKLIFLGNVFVFISDNLCEIGCLFLSPFLKCPHASFLIQRGLFLNLSTSVFCYWRCQTQSLPSTLPETFQEHTHAHASIRSNP